MWFRTPLEGMGGAPHGRSAPRPRGVRVPKSDVTHHAGRWYAAPLNGIDGRRPRRHPDTGAVIYVDTRDQATELPAHQPARHTTTPGLTAT